MKYSFRRLMFKIKSLFKKKERYSISIKFHDFTQGIWQMHILDTHTGRMTGMRFKQKDGDTEEQNIDYANDLLLRLNPYYFTNKK